MTTPWEVECDVVVVGSGSGGGVMAAELVAAGLNVLVLEKGEHYTAEDFRRWQETEAMSKTIERGGLLTTEDAAIVVLAGSCVGGGSTVNWSASFRTPDTVLEDWSNTGMKHFSPLGGAFSDSLDAVHKLLSVNTHYSHRCDKNDNGDSDPNFVVNGSNEIFWKSAESCGYKPEKIPRNVKGCIDCGHCTFGCPYNAKQSSATALLEPILLRQEKEKIMRPPKSAVGRLTLISNCRVAKIITAAAAASTSPSQKRAEGIEGTVFEYAEDRGRKRGAPIRERQLTVRAKVVVCSAGINVQSILCFCLDFILLLPALQFSDLI